MMMSRRRVVVLMMGSVGVLAIGALVARSGPRSVDGTTERSAESPGSSDSPAPSTAPEKVTTPDGSGTTAIADPDGAASPVTLTSRDVAALASEAALMARLQQLGESNRPLSLQLAREGNARFPHGPDAPQRAFIVAKSLVDMGRFKEAQQEARLMLKNYPNDPYTLDVERHLLSNPLE
jgi:TolA-binding protein